MMNELNLVIPFIIAVVVLLVIDLKVIGRKAHAVTTKEAAIWTFIFIAVSLAFAWYTYSLYGKEKATEFLTAYVIEKTLSVDNLFVFILIFAYFKVPKEYHHKVLFWGIIGAIVLRAIFIFAGVSLMKFLDLNILGLEINILLLLFGGFLVYAGTKAMLEAMNNIPDEEEQDFENSAGAKFVRKLFGGKVTKTYRGDKFVVEELLRDPLHRAVKYVKVATPLLVVVGVVEFTDLLFAVYSIPAIFSVSKDPFILYSSNIFAILGLRSMYFLLANMLPLFKYLKHGVALILAFIGAKMVTAPVFHISGTLSLWIVLGILTLSILISLLTFKKEPETV
jgi:tellurite resistance protein TerC